MITKFLKQHPFKCPECSARIPTKRTQKRKWWGLIGVYLIGPIYLVGIMVWSAKSGPSNAREAGLFATLGFLLGLRTIAALIVIPLSIAAFVLYRKSFIGYEIHCDKCKQTSVYKIDKIHS